MAENRQKDEQGTMGRPETKLWRRAKAQQQLERNRPNGTWLPITAATQSLLLSPNFGGQPFHSLGAHKGCPQGLWAAIGSAGEGRDFRRASQSASSSFSCLGHPGNSVVQKGHGMWTRRQLALFWPTTAGSAKSMANEDGGKKRTLKSDGMEEESRKPWLMMDEGIKQS